MGLANDPSQDKRQSNQFNSNPLKYSGLAIQLLVAIGLAGWLGHFIDNYISIKFPAFMLLFGFFAFGSMLFVIYKSIVNH